MKVRNQAGGGQPPPASLPDFVRCRAREDMQNEDFPNGSVESGEVFKLPRGMAIAHERMGLLDILDKPPNPISAVGVAKQQYASPAAQASRKKTSTGPRKAKRESSS